MQLAPEGATIELFRGTGDLPHFNPDHDSENPPLPVAAFRARVAAADGMLISCPEYARGIPGSFKNALDWLVGGTEFTQMPVALFNASPRASDAQAALRLVLETMSARLVEDASIALPLLARGLDADAIAADPAMAASIRAALRAFSASIRTHPREFN
jgi:NAD(P)H-dependent FMN reductase